MKLDRQKIGDNVYIGIDINLTGNAVTIITQRQVFMRWIPVSMQGLPLDNMVPVWCKVAEETWSKVAWIVANKQSFVAIEDPTGMERKAWQAAAMINKMIGMLSGIFHNFNSKIYLPSSVIWKKITIGDGKADKPKVQREMFKVLYPNAKKSDGDRIENHHLADSTALACYAYILNTQEDKSDGREQSDSNG